MKKKKALLLIVIATAACALAALKIYGLRNGHDKAELTMFGNVDLRQVDLAFNGSQRIASLLVEEGELVKKGQILGYLDKERLEAAVARADAQVQAQQHVVERLENGTRPEEIDQARANVQSAQADLKNARLNLERKSSVTIAGAVSKQDLDAARMAVDVAEAKLKVNQKALDLALIGPRKEDIAQARATLRANQAELALLKQDLADATLISPTDGIIQNRLLEPGDMASPQKPVFTVAVTDPKWVRVYVTEPNLGKIKAGMQATVTTDSFPGKPYEGWIGFISPTAEFTPKSVETTELRTALVYEVRVFVKDPKDELRLGMPATVHITPTQESAHPGDGRGGKKQAIRDGQ